MVIAIFAGVHLVCLEGDKLLAVAGGQLRGNLIPMRSQFFKSRLMKVYHKCGFLCAVGDIGPHGMAGHGAKIQMAFCPLQCVFQAAVAVSDPAMIVDVAP